MHHTYVNPLCLPEIPVLKCKNHQKNEEKQGDPFAVGKMICEHLPATHERFKPVFRGMLPYLGKMIRVQRQIRQDFIIRMNGIFIPVMVHYGILKILKTGILQM